VHDDMSADLAGLHSARPPRVAPVSSRDDLWHFRDRPRARAPEHGPLAPVSPLPLRRRPRGEVDAWADALLRRVPAALPSFGSPKWLASPEAVRVASCVAAALSWRRHCSAEQVAEDLRAELAAADRLVLERLKGAAVDVSQALDWTAEAALPSHAELQRRRGHRT
jgi:hypothetical protein